MTDAPAVEDAPVFTIHEGVRNISVDYDPTENRVHVRANHETSVSDEDLVGWIIANYETHMSHEDFRVEAYCLALKAKEQSSEIGKKVVELSTRLRTIYWMDAMNDGATDEQAQVEADARLNAPLSLGTSK